MLGKGENDSLAWYIQNLKYVLEKPTPVRVVEQAQILTQMSVLKQCLLFNNIEASIMIYKLAHRIERIDFQDYITSQEDLEVIVERLPAQQYFKIFNNFGENYHTRKIKEAILPKQSRNKGTQLTTFIQDSAIINSETPQLGLKRE